MLTKNFYSFMRAAFQGTNAVFVTTNGTEVSKTYYNPNLPFAIMNKWGSDKSTAGVSFGTGTTPATVSDYALESILGTTQIGVSTPSAVSFSRYATYEEYTVTFGITNKTAEAITISEVGLTACPNTNGTPYPFVLVDRTVLAEPITIPAGQSKQITYTIRFNYGV